MYISLISAIFLTISFLFGSLGFFPLLIFCLWILSSFFDNHPQGIPLALTVHELDILVLLIPRTLEFLLVYFLTQGLFRINSCSSWSKAKETSAWTQKAIPDNDVQFFSTHAEDCLPSLEGFLFSSLSLFQGLFSVSFPGLFTFLLISFGASHPQCVCVCVWLETFSSHGPGIVSFRLQAKGKTGWWLNCFLPSTGLQGSFTAGKFPQPLIEPVGLWHLIVWEEGLLLDPPIARVLALDSLLSLCPGRQKTRTNNNFFFFLTLVSNVFREKSPFIDQYMPLGAHLHQTLGLNISFFLADHPCF